MQELYDDMLPGITERQAASDLPRERPAGLDAWLRHGGTHHQVMHLGHQLATWRVFCDLTGIELETA